jgi:TolB-like protein/Flp pilus assembly protein TadD
MRPNGKDTAPVTQPFAESKPAAPAVGDKTIAVLPFVDMSQAKDQEYFSDGLSEELLNLLAKIPALSVTSRSSAFSYKGKDVKLAQVARELGVAHILEGSVRKSGNRLRITAQLIDARTDKHIWSETYDRSLDDIFAVQDDIAGAVVSQLKVTLLGAAPKAKVVDPKAYAISLQARQLRRQGTRDSVAQALSLYSEALAIDPKFAGACEGITLCRLRQYIMEWGTAGEIQQLAREAANQTLTLDPDSATAYTTLGSLILRSPGGDLATVARHYEHALALDPANAETVYDSLILFPILGRSEEAVAFGEYCVAHDPVGSFAHSTLGRVYHWIGRRDEAISSFRTALRLSPDVALLHNMIGTALLKKDAKAALAEFLQGPLDEDRPINLAMAYHALGQKAQSDAALAEGISKYEKTAAWNIAYALAFRGESDRAFEWLDKAIAYQDTGLTLSAFNPGFENLHSDPRWLPFLRKIGRAPEQVAGIKFNPKLPGK